MKQTSEFVVIRNKETGRFLEAYKDRGNLAYEADSTKELFQALTMPIDFYEQQKHRIKHLAKAFDGEIVKVQAEYTLTYPNGDELREIKHKCDDFNKMMKAMLEDVLGGK